MTPTDLLASAPVHPIGHVAVILGHSHGRKDGGRSIVRQLIREGKLRLVDPDQAVTRWTISSAEIRRYIGESEAS